MRGSGECKETVVDVENSTGRPEKAPKKRKKDNSRNFKLRRVKSLSFSQPSIVMVCASTVRCFLETKDPDVAVLSAKKIILVGLGKIFE